MWSALAGESCWPAAQVEDRIAHKLPRTVIGHIAAAVDLVNFNALLREQFVRRKDVGARAVAAQRQHRRMLHQQQRVADSTGLARSHNLILNAQAFRIGNAPELEEMDDAITAHLNPLQHR